MTTKVRKGEEGRWRARAGGRGEKDEIVAETYQQEEARGSTNWKMRVNKKRCELGEKKK
jgi:hypothetical protein